MLMSTDLVALRRQSGAVVGDHVETGAVRGSQRRWLAALMTACAIALASTAADAGSRKKTSAPRATQTQRVPDDPFKACDLQLRDYLIDGGTWLTPTDIKIDEARLTLDVAHAFGQSGRSVPRSLRGDSDDERRQLLRAHLAELRGAVGAAKVGQAWFIIAAKATLPTAARTALGESASQWYGLLLADMGGRCRTVAHFPNVSLDNLPPELITEMKR
jgi:hypothetical protein